MNTNTLNRHLENKSTKDITEMVNEIMGIFEKYDEKYSMKHESFHLLQINKTIDGYKKMVFEDKLFKINDIYNMLRILLKDRYFNRILKRRTEDLLNKVELLD